MGNSRWSNVDWNAHAQATQSQTRSQIFTQSGIHPDLDPTKVKFRESVISDANPDPTPIILGVDETGSMGVYAEKIIKRELGVVMKEIYDRKPVPDPQIMCMALGDANSDSAPLQVTQFEASIVLADQLKNFYLEANGGGNGGESYPLAWFFAAYKTKCDAFRKRRRKGYLFTIGDECPHPVLKRDHLRRFVGVDAECDMSAKILLDAVQKDWNVFHLIVNPVNYQPVVATWKQWLGERAIVVTDTDKLAEGIVSIIQMIEGVAAQTVVDSWDGSTSVAVQDIARQLAYHP